MPRPDRDVMEYQDHTDDDVYETSDLYLGSFLKARGMNLKGVRRDGRRVMFVFNDDPTRRALIMDFYNDGMVSVRDYRNALQDLKAIVFNV